MRVLFNLCSGNRLFLYLIKVLTVLSVLYIIYKTFLVLHLVCLSKVFQRTISFRFYFRFVVESVCKVKRFILNRQIFSKFFFKKVFQAVRMTRLTLSRSLTLCKVRYSVQLAGVTPTLALCFSMSLFLTSFPLESGCKGTHFFRFCKYHADFFSDFFHTLVKIRCKTACYEMLFFRLQLHVKNEVHIIIYKKRKINTHDSLMPHQSNTINDILPTPET